MLTQEIFEPFGGNWKWASLDYRGVARVHTFQPSFSKDGRVMLPVSQHNSEPSPAFDVNELPHNWQPVWMERTNPPPFNTDRFGRTLPDGADPFAADDVQVCPPPIGQPVICNIPGPAGYVCTRSYAHEGPCTCIKDGEEGTAPSIFTEGFMKFPIGINVIVEGQYEGVVIGFDSEKQMYVIRDLEIGHYAGIREDSLRVVISQFEEFVVKLCKLLGWSPDMEGAQADARKLFDAGARL